MYCIVVWNGVLCNVVLRFVVLCCVVCCVLCCGVLCCVVLCVVVLCLMFCCVMLRCVVLCSWCCGVVLHCVVLRCVVMFFCSVEKKSHRYGLWCMASYRVVLYITVLYGMCRELHCIGISGCVLFSCVALQWFAMSCFLLYKIVLWFLVL